MVRRFSVAVVIAVVMAVVFAGAASAAYLECYYPWMCWPFL